MKWPRSTLRSSLGSLRKCGSYKYAKGPFHVKILKSKKYLYFYLKAFYLGVTNEWLEAMALAMGIHKKVVFDECQCQQLFSPFEVLSFSKQIQSAKLPKSLANCFKIVKLANWCKILTQRCNRVERRSASLWKGTARCFFLLSADGENAFEANFGQYHCKTLCRLSTSACQPSTGWCAGRWGPAARSKYSRCLHR